MKSKYQLSDYFDYFANWNPQLLREIKGRLKGKNIIGIVAISLAIQFLVVINFLGQLPDSQDETLKNISFKVYEAKKHYSRYCTGGIPKHKTYHYDSGSMLCHQDMHNHWIVNWQLFWFDNFVTLSVIGIVVLLVLGTYFLLSNVIAEQQKDTLNLIRLSPQSASNILLGKILGVPILLYLFIAIGLPLYVVSAVQAHISLSLLLIFGIAIIAGCFFFYSLGLVISFLIPKSITAWGTTIAIAIFLFFTTTLSTYGYQTHSETLFDWVLMFNPNNLIIYLGKSTAIPFRYFDYPSSPILGGGSYREKVLDPVFLSNVLFYGQALWSKLSVGFGLIITNYCLWTYWIWQGLKRRFYNPENTVISKQQSYWFTSCFTAIALGFSLQNIERYTYEDNFFLSMAILQFALLLLFIGLTFALSSQRQTLHDWARYRHQMKRKGNVLWRELILGEKSPSTVAIVINAMIASLYVMPSFFIFTRGENRWFAFCNLALILGTILCYAAIAQLILLSKSKHRVIQASLTIGCLTIALPMLLGIFEYSPYHNPVIWLFTSFPFVAVEKVAGNTIAFAILGQWLAITLMSLQITRKLRQAGRSETYRIVNGRSV